jgi:small subunit ribosomal protein S14
MAKTAVINRNEKRRKTVKKFEVKRTALLAIINDFKQPEDERMAARMQLQKLPRNASPTRVRNRCKITGRPRGVYRKFGLGRNKLREFVMRGEVPGMTKASW